MGLSWLIGTERVGLQKRAIPLIKSGVGWNMSKWEKFELAPDNSAGDLISLITEDHIFYAIWDYIFMPLDFWLRDQVEGSILGIRP